MKLTNIMLYVAAISLLMCSASRLFAGNWGGYVAMWSDPTIITQVSGKFRVPQVGLGDDTSQTNTMSAWVGIGGVNGNQMLAQLGVGCDVSTDSSVTCYGLYAFGHGYSGFLNKNTYPVAAGDIISASASCTANCVANGHNESWTLTLTDFRQDGSVKWAWADSSFTGKASDLESAEWIVEAQAKPPCCDSLYPLDSFGTVPFVSAAYNNAAADLTTAIKVKLRTPTGRGYPSPPNTTNDGFVVCGGLASQRAAVCSGTPMLYDSKGIAPDKF